MDVIKIWKNLEEKSKTELISYIISLLGTLEGNSLNQKSQFKDFYRFLTLDKEWKN